MYRRAYALRRSTRTPTSPGTGCSERYWGRLNPERDDNWVFGDKRTGRYLLKFSWFKIVSDTSWSEARPPPTTRVLREYWWARRKVNIRHLTASDVELANDQDWVCPVCGMDLINGEELHRHHKEPQGEGGSDAYGNRELVHLYCHQQLTAEWRVRSPTRYTHGTSSFCASARPCLRSIAAE